MISVGVITATRAEYGLLKPVILELNKNKNIDLRLIVTGTHLSKKYGYTINDINADKIKIYKKIRIITEKNQNIIDIFNNAVSKFNSLLKKNKFDTIILLGDRYETLGFAIACMFNNVPICHLYGGETTEGAIDEAIRHSITKMSYLHFTSCKEYRKRVIQLGEDPNLVYNVGSTGIENVLNVKLYSKAEISKLLNFKLNKYFVVTYHPVTLKTIKDNIKDFNLLLNAISVYKDYQVVFTKSNADTGGDEINEMIDRYTKHHDNSISFFSLGVKKYLSLAKHSTAVIGNSSSGLTEIPALLVPTVNIGDRQKGRITVKSVINCGNSLREINNGIDLAIRFNNKLTLSDIPMYKKNSSKRIADIIAKVFSKKVNLMKKFYDYEI